METSADDGLPLRDGPPPWSGPPPWDGPAPLTARRDRATARRQSTALLRQLILDGTLESGQRLNEVELAARFEMSRGPVRESLQRLAAEGLVTLVPHKGSFVRSFTRGDLAELYEVRSILETAAVRLAAERRSPAEVVRAEELLDATRRALRADVGYPADLDFHLSVLSMVHNDALVRQVRDVLSQLRLARARSARSATRSEDAFEEHAAVLRRVADGDAAQAAAAMAEHLHHSCESATAAFEASASGGQRAAGTRR